MKFNCMTIIVLAAALVLMGLVACSPAPSPCGPCPLAAAKASDKPAKAAQDQAEKKKPEDPKVLDRIVLIVNSRACKCVKARCQEGEAALMSALSKHEGMPEVDKIDNSENSERVKELLKIYPASLLPIIYFIGPGDELIGQLEGEFIEVDIDQVLKGFTVSSE